MDDSAQTPQPPGNYYRNVRMDIRPLLPPRIDRVLEVGCATGATLAWLKREYGATETVGIELETKLADVLNTNVDHAFVGDPDAHLRDIGSFDLVLLLDVLEHMVDPWTALKSYAAKLAPGGTVIASIPNLAYYQVSLPLLLKRRFRYMAHGIMDRTHLRFFVDETISDMFRGCGLAIREKIMLMGPSADRRLRLASRLTLGKLDDYFTIQYLVSAHVRENGVAEPPPRVGRTWVNYAGLLD